MRAWTDIRRLKAPQWMFAMLFRLVTLVKFSTSEFIEDFHKETVTPSIYILYGASPSLEERPLVRVHAKKDVWLDVVAFDFQKATEAVRLWQHIQNMPKLPNSAVKIYVHQVPHCAGEELLHVFTSKSEGFGWDRAVQLHALHIRSVHNAIMSSQALVQSPEEATVFYIPAFFSLLVEQFIDSDMSSLNSLNCISDAWNSIPHEFFHRNAGYDHFIVAGTCFPYSVCDATECDVTAYHPFAKNVMVLVGGVRDSVHSHPDFAFTQGAGFHRFGQIFVPFPVTLDCHRVLTLADPLRRRETVVSFVGTENSRVRSIFRVLQEDLRATQRNRSEFYIKVLQDVEGEDGEATRKATLDAGGSRPIDELYADSEFCLVLPGHVYDLGRRGFDAMARACIPVVVSMAPMFVAVPFAGQIPWQDFAIFTSVRDVHDAANILESLLQATQHEEGRAAIRSRRSRMLQYLPQLFLPPLENCLAGTPTALDGILQELAMRHVAWSTIATARSPGWASPGEVAV
ncbi:Xyloglucan galactosyltransferase XLT2 (Glycosyltransferase 18) (AtGT18) (Protein XYLOGLUCAN L-SIDE CHAIN GALACTOSYLTRANSFERASE POSITION 2) [Durusdinium trenchii]|uniref:Xyloglucan galactosyltransferase XLT2 (Glycosyltransferase 18) (AtGT18) (Protein XYLOGLUCAN L-SIDE CHAIN GALACTOSYLTRANSFERASE POSITION 2) n=1 Tax=Durusdinium trenchii TaxID=1381693 RepID=A0ABP0NH62_9DINO